MKMNNQIARDRKKSKHRFLWRITGRGKTIFNLADSLEYKFLKTNDIEDIEGAIELHRTALALRPEGQPDRHSSLHNLARCLHHRYRKQDTLPDLEEAITHGRAALDLRPEGHPKRSYSLHNLAVYLSDWYGKQASVADLEEAITLSRAALELRPPGHSDHVLTLSHLGVYLRRKFLKLGATSDLDEALSLHRSALDLRPEGHRDRSHSLYNLALCFSSRYRKQATVADLEEAITLGRAALKLCPPGHSHRAPTLYCLGSDLRRRFLKLGATSDLDEALSLHRSSLNLRPEGHPDQSDSLYSLALCFSDWYSKRASVADLDEAIMLCRAALKLRPPGHSDHVQTLISLGSDLRRRFLALGATSDLDEALSLHRSALDLRPEGHSDRSDSLHSLALCFSDRYSQQASVADLEEAIMLYRAALKLRPPGHSDYALTLFNLGLDLWRRFLEFDTTSDLDEALSLHRLALDLCPEGYPNSSHLLHNLAICFSNQYVKQASVTSLDEAITLGRAALNLCPPDNSDHRALILSDLGNDLRHRFQKLGVNADLNEAISHHRSALDLRPVGHSARLVSLNQLASCLGLRFEKLEAPADLDSLIALNRAILDLHPPDHDGHVESIDKLLLHLRKRRGSFGMTSDLAECITLGYIALGLRQPDDPGHATCYRHLVEDFQCMLRKLEDASNVLNSSHLTTFLRSLVACVGDVASKGHVLYSDEIIAVAQAAATWLQDRFKQHGNIADLDEAITLHEEVSKCFLSGNPKRAAPLHKLAWCLRKRSIKQSTQIDLDNAIKFGKDASALYPLNDAGRVESLRNLASCHQLRMERKGLSLLDCLDATANQKEQVIDNIISDVLKAFPFRLLDVQKGMLCDRSTQISHFKQSKEYKQLVSSTLDTAPQTAPKVVSTYFQYVTLSHRWASSEPLFRHIKAEVIYDLGPNNGLFSKLQLFCLATLRHGYFWAWSDTCCIDKESSAEVQEAIGSMFSWYRKSVLTMVHLADIPDTRPLTCSEWFKRGWTLQELLAPRALLFFTKNWSPYRGIRSNHKEDTTILDMLEQATRIMPRHISSFDPGVDDARVRLQWASTRSTTRPEDIAYSLFGVFGVHLPVLYGETAEYALGRLLADVISRSGDIKILDWTGKSSKFHSCFPDSILPYQTPIQLPSLDRKASPKIEYIEQARNMQQKLSNLPLPQFSNIRLSLPCIVHHVKIVRTGTDTASPHVYRIRTTGLESIEVTLSQPLEDISTNSYVLIRPWRPNLLDSSVVDDASVMDDDTPTSKWLAMMERPFSALLLKQLHQNEYMRVATSVHILARPTGSDGALRGEITTLTIL